MNEAIDSILRFWFGPLDAQGMSSAQQSKLWFRGGKAVDQQCQQQFGELVDAALAGELSSWADRDDGLVALVLLLDQFTRNIYRDSDAAFAGDPQALALVQRAVAQGRHLLLPAIHQVFVYIPYEHSESLAVQLVGVELFDGLIARVKRPELNGFRDYALAHRDVIAQFGRFPHRNVLLGRASTPDEEAYLAKHGGF